MSKAAGQVTFQQGRLIACSILATLALLRQVSPATDAALQRQARRLYRTEPWKPHEFGKRWKPREPKLHVLHGKRAPGSPRSGCVGVPRLGQSRSSRFLQMTCTFPIFLTKHECETTAILATQPVHLPWPLVTSSAVLYRLHLSPPPKSQSLFRRLLKATSCSGRPSASGRSLCRRRWDRGGAWLSESLGNAPEVWGFVVRPRRMWSNLPKLRTSSHALKIV